MQVFLQHLLALNNNNLYSMFYFDICPPALRVTVCYLIYISRFACRMCTRQKEMKEYLKMNVQKNEQQEKSEKGNNKDMKK